jgi:ABC-type cobalt transport system substrate-binding protein
MRKTSKTARITILLLVLCLISTAMLSGTFAKYTSEYAGADTALIAKWEIEFDDDNTTTSGTTLWC